MAPNDSPERLRAFSDALFAVLITILVLELKPPATPTLGALRSLWPMGLSYAVSYLFIAIVWVNHHHVLRDAEVATPRLVWGNFAHLFSVSLVPFFTAWIAETHLAAVPVALYAGVFVLVNATYIALYWEVVDRGPVDVAPRVRRIMRIRSIATLLLFATASVVALRAPLAGLVLICCCLTLYVRPDAPVLRARSTTRLPAHPPASTRITNPPHVT
jgi:TMEM175 potassium channel family protein